VILWDVSDPTRPHRLGDPLTGHTDPVFEVAWSADGRSLATGSTDHTAILWDVANLGRFLGLNTERACVAAGGGLTDEQWARYVPTLPYEPTCT
jgi:WD40 repeat protein